MHYTKLEGKRLCASCAKHKEECVEVTMGNFVTSPKGIFCKDCRVELIGELEACTYD